jgi:hypothetical protein
MHAFIALSAARMLRQLVVVSRSPTVTDRLNASISEPQWLGVFFGWCWYCWSMCVCRA